MKSKVGFIGGGNMSTAIARGIVNSGTLPASQLWVSGPHIHDEQYKHWQQMGINTTTSNGELYSNCEIVFLGVKPHILSNAVHDLKCTLSTSKCVNTVFVSMLAGIKIAELQKVLEEIKMPDCIHSVIRIMPNTPMMVGHGACLVSPEPGFKDTKALNDVLTLLNSCSVCNVVDEKLIDPLGALTACGPAFMYVIIEALADGAVKQGVPRALSMRMAAQMVVGSGQMVMKTGKHPGQLKDEVCSPGGSTICGVTALEDGRVRASMIAAIEAATLRTKQLGGEGK